MFSYAKEKTYVGNLENWYRQVSALRPCECKYYLTLIYLTLKNHETKDSKRLLEQLFAFTAKLDQVLSATSSSEEDIKQMTTEFKKLVAMSNTQFVPVQIGYFLLKIAGVLVAIVTGFICGLIGGVAGFVRGIGKLENPFYHGAMGYVAGMCIGATFAYRAPKALLTSDYFSQLKFCLDELTECVLDPKLPRIEKYFGPVKEKYFKGSEEMFNACKAKTAVTFSIAAVKATFLSPVLAGYLGHHAFIEIPAGQLGQETEPTLIELSTSPTDTSLTCKKEERTISGGQMIEMLALHELLQTRNPTDMKFVLTKMTPGDIDCLSHVNCLLIGIGEPPANKVRRFDGSENKVGRFVGYFFERGCAFRGDVFDPSTMPSLG